MKKTILLAATAATLAGCQTGTGNGGQTPSHAKSIIVYYSQTGATKAVAEELQRQTGADIESIEAVKPYDGDFGQTIARCQEEMAAGTLPELKPLTANIADYDTVYIGYPVWFGTLAMPVTTLLKSVQLDGKVVVPFCTFGSGGLTRTVASMREALPGAKVLDGYGVRNARIAKAPAEIAQFLINIGVKDGQKLQLPDFSAQADLTDAEKAVFDAACGDYPMPLGTPLSVGNRKVEGGTEYLFTVHQDDGKGHAGEATIYVTASDSAGVRPEFTLVER